MNTKPKFKKKQIKKHVKAVKNKERKKNESQMVKSFYTSKTCGFQKNVFIYGFRQSVTPHSTETKCPVTGSMKEHFTEIQFVFQFLVMLVFCKKEP